MSQLVSSHINSVDKRSEKLASVTVIHPFTVPVSIVQWPSRLIGDVDKRSDRPTKSIYRIAAMCIKVILVCSRRIIMRGYCFGIPAIMCWCDEAVGGK